MYITKQSLSLLCITLYSQEYITVRVPRCLWISLCTSWVIFRTISPPIWEVQEAALFFWEISQNSRITSEVLLSNNMTSSWRQTAGKKFQNVRVISHWSKIDGNSSRTAIRLDIKMAVVSLFARCFQRDTRSLSLLSIKYRLLLGVV